MYVCIHTYMDLLSIHAQTHTHSLSLSLSLSRTHTHKHNRWAKDEMRIARISAWLPDNDAVLFLLPPHAILLIFPHCAHQRLSPFGVIESCCQTTTRYAFSLLFPVCFCLSPWRASAPGCQTTTHVFVVGLFCAFVVGLFCGCQTTTRCSFSFLFP